jgi:hypothetical protein
MALGDAEGLPLGRDSRARNLDRKAVNSHFVLLMAERIGSNAYPAPTPILVRDTAGRSTLFRIFDMQHQRISLAALSPAARI